MLDKLTAFQDLLLEEQDAIRSLSFGQFTSVTIRKTQLLDEIRQLEQQRRNEATPSMAWVRWCAVSAGVRPAGKGKVSKQVVGV